MGNANITLCNRLKRIADTATRLQAQVAQQGLTAQNAEHLLNQVKEMRGENHACGKHIEAAIDRLGRDIEPDIDLDDTGPLRFTGAALPGADLPGAEGGGA